jgi:type I restriction enzyme, S subunit
MTSKEPEIRFSGCTDVWKQYKLMEIAEFNPKSILPDQFEYIDLESVSGTNLISHRTEQKETAPSRAQRLAKRGDVFYQTVRPYQKNNYLFDLPYDNYVFSTGYAQMRPNIDSYFLLSKIQEEKFVSNVLDRCTGTSYPAINSNDLAQIEIEVPTLSEEQAKIGNFFKQLDDIIALHQSEYKKIIHLKKAMLQKMFPQKRECVPELRFRGFTDGWEQHELGDKVEFYSGLTYSPENIVDSGTLVLRSSNVKNGEIVPADNVYVNPEVVNSQNVEIGDVIVVVRNGSRNLIGKHACVKKKMDNTVIGAFMTGIRSESPSFINALLDSNQFAIEINKNLGATINQITTGEFKKMKFSFPSYEEQEKIGGFFGKIDNIIALHQEQFNKLQQIKKSMLQKMFV